MSPVSMDQRVKWLLRKAEDIGLSSMTNEQQRRVLQQYTSDSDLIDAVIAKVVEATHEYETTSRVSRK